jgi:hypothetical protein
MSGAALAIVGDALAELPHLDVAVEDVKRLVLVCDDGLLDEARRRAEAYALYEKRAGNFERERHFAILRLLAEAGLGILSFDDPGLAETSQARVRWRLLARRESQGMSSDDVSALDKNRRDARRRGRNDG